MALRMLSNLDSCKHFVLRDGMALSIDSKSLSHFPPVEDVVIPKTIEYIGHNAFNMHESMKSLMLNDGLRRIGNSAFDSCDDLKVLKLPDTVETVGEPQKIQMRRSHNVYNSDCGIDENYVCRYIFPNDKYSEEDYDEVMSEADYFFGEPPG